MLTTTSAESIAALGRRMKSGGFHRWQPVAQDRGEDLDHLPVAVVGAGKLVDGI
jgi:hypothetical protein